MDRILRRRLRAARRMAFTRGFAAKTSIFAVLTITTALAFHTSSLPVALLEVGEVWTGETLVASEDVAIDKSADSLAADRARARRNTEPVFNALNDAGERVVANLETLQQQMDGIMHAYRDYRMNAQRAQLVSDTLADVDYRERAEADSARYIRARQNAMVFLSDEQWRVLGDDFVSQDTGSPSAAVPGQFLYDFSLDRLWAHATAFARTEVVDIPADSIYTDFLKVRDTGANTFERIAKTSVFDQARIYQSMEEDLAPYFAGGSEATLASALVNAVFVASLQYDAGATERARDLAAGSVSPARGMIAEDEIVVRKGEIITPEILQRLESLESKRSGVNGPKLYAPRSIGKVLLALCTFGIFFVYLLMARRHLFDDNKDMLLMSLLYVAVIGLFALAVRSSPAYMFAVPTLIVSVVLTVVFDSRVGLFGTVALALLGGLILGVDHALEFVFATIAGGSLAVFTVRGARNRAQLFVAAVSAFGGYALVFLAFELFESEGRSFLSHVMMAGINSFLMITAYPLLWVVEKVFDVSSDLRLVELSDYNQPLLKRLQQEATGTFSHSMQVANLAEAAAAAIGANALLTRVAGLYHDVGKLVQPEFFVENQRAGVNPHSELSPQESADIIRNHVRHGLALAADHGLPNSVSVFIPTHHGTMRVEYFYHQARQAGGEVDEAAFRYPGPCPQTKEAAVLMLTDGVEAACMSISEPSLEKFKERIDAVFKARTDDGQLDESELTFMDLKIIKETFIKRLAAIHHVRVKYPGQE